MGAGHQKYEVMMRSLDFQLSPLSFSGEGRGYVSVGYF